jgi:hypothetical protein
MIVKISEGVFNFVQECKWLWRIVKEYERMLHVKCLS